MKASSAAALLVLVVAVSGCNGTANNGDKLANVRGKGFGAAGPLFPKHPWKVAYSWDCAKQLGEGRNVLQQVRLEVHHADDGSYVERNYLVQRKGKKGDGVLSYDRPGAYVVSITTDCEFQLHVDQVRSAA